MVRPLLFFWLLTCSSFAGAQSQSAASGEAQVAAQAASVVTFTLDFPNSVPEHYAIRIPSGGASHYESSGRLSPDSDVADSFDFDFRISTETRSKILALRPRLDIFKRISTPTARTLLLPGRKLSAMRTRATPARPPTTTLQTRRSRNSPRSFRTSLPHLSSGIACITTTAIRSSRSTRSLSACRSWHRPACSQK